MDGDHKSEIRDSQIRDLLEKVRRHSFGQYLRRIRLNTIRAFRNQEVNLDFPVTALIGTNGGGKSTILGAAAMAYRTTKPATFFPKSSIGDEAMEDWNIGYDLIEKEINKTQTIVRSARFRTSRWSRDDLIDRPLSYFGIQRTVPAGERTEFKKFASAMYKFDGQREKLQEQVRSEVAKILGKDMSHFQKVTVSETQQLYVGGNGEVTYSEFHFGAGESSILRMVSEVEATAPNSIILIEEIENGLHPVAVRRMVEYLIDAAARKSIQTLFTTHSNDALHPLPPEAIWSSIDGRVRQGRISIEALRAITGRIDESLAIFVEDDFSKRWVEAIIRTALPSHVDEVGVYAVSGGGDSQALSIHKHHKLNPAIQKIESVCILDGDSEIDEDVDNGVLKLPGASPEATVFDFVRSRLDVLSMKLAVGMHLPATQEGAVRDAVLTVAMTNRDHHLLFSQVGQRSQLVPEIIVASAFVAQWIEGNPDEVQRVADFIVKKLPDSSAATDRP